MKVWLWELHRRPMKNNRKPTTKILETIQSNLLPENLLPSTRTLASYYSFWITDNYCSSLMHPDTIRQLNYCSPAINLFSTLVEFSNKILTTTHPPIADVNLVSQPKVHKQHQQVTAKHVFQVSSGGDKGLRHQIHTSPSTPTANNLATSR